MNEQYFFFDQDSDSHWYMIPEGLRLLWNDLNFDFNNNEDADKFIVLFGSYRIDGHPKHYCFSHPLIVRR